MIKKINKFIIPIIVGVLVAGVSSAQVVAPNFFKRVGDNITLLKSNWELGSASERISKIWTNDLDALNLTIGGTTTGQIIIDDTNTEALLVRSSGDSADTLAVDTVNGKLVLGDNVYSAFVFESVIPDGSLDTYGQVFRNKNRVFSDIVPPGTFSPSVMPFAFENGSSDFSNIIAGVFDNDIDVGGGNIIRQWGFNVKPSSNFNSSDFGVAFNDTNAVSPGTFFGAVGEIFSPNGLFVHGDMTGAGSRHITIGTSDYDGGNSSGESLADWLLFGAERRIAFVREDVNHAGLEIQVENVTDNPPALDLTGNLGFGNDITATNWSISKGGTFSTQGDVVISGGGEINYFDNAGGNAILVTDSAGSVYGDANSLSFSPSGYLGIGISTPALALDIRGEDTFSSFAGISGSGVNPTLGFLRTNGTVASPSAVLNGDLLGLISFNGWGATAPGSGSVGIIGTATENWDDVAHGAKLEFSTTPNGNSSAQVAMTIDGSGSVGVGTGTPNGLFNINSGSGNVIDQLVISGISNDGFGINFDGSYNNSAFGGLNFATIVTTSGASMSVASSDTTDVNNDVGGFINLNPKSYSGEGILIGTLDYTDPVNTKDINLSTGVAYGSSGDSGNINLSTGSSTSGNSGSISFNVGTGAVSRGNISFNSSDLFIDGVTANVGVGTASPLEKLDVNGGVGADYFTVRNSTPVSCDSSNVGRIVYQDGGVGVADTLSICMKSASDTYNYVEIVNGGL